MDENRQPELPWRFPPFVVSSDTSRGAAASVAPVTGKLRRRVFEYIAVFCSQGSTCDQAESDLGMSHQTCSARFNELRNAGHIVDSGRRRKTRSGRNAAVYCLPEYADG